MSSPQSNPNGSPLQSTLHASSSQTPPSSSSSTPSKKKLGYSQLSLVSTNSDQSSNLEEAFDIPPSEWLPKAMHNHSDILELRERLRPLSQSKSFSRNKRSGKTEATGVINDTILTKLLMQYLAEENLTSTLKVIQEETKTKYIPSELDTNSLVTMLRVGVKQTSDWFEEIPESSELDPEVETYHAYSHVDQDLADQSNKEQNIMEDRYDDKQFVKNGDGTIGLSTLNRLIWWFISNVSNSSDVNEYKKIFFLTYQTFTTGEILLAKFTQIYRLLISDSESTEAFQVMQLLKFWVDQQPNDFNEKLLTTLTSFNDNQVSNNLWSKNLRQAISKLSENQNISKRKEVKDPPEPKVPKNIFSPTLTLDDVDEEEIARQLCLIDFGLYEQIKSSEFLIKGWTKPQFRSKAVNLLAMIRRFNDLTKWIASSILAEQNQKIRVKLLSRYLKICEHLRNLNNFHSLMAIFGGINNTQVFRTKTIRKDLSKQQQEFYTELEKLFTAELNYKAYRIAYQNAKPPAIPFLGIHLRDLTFVDEGSPDKIDNMINLNKRRTLWRVISNTIRYQPIPYNFLKVHQISLFLTELKLDQEQTQILDLSHDNIQNFATTKY